MYYDIVPSLKKVYLHKRNIILHLTMHGRELILVKYSICYAWYHV